MKTALERKLTPEQVAEMGRLCQSWVRHLVAHNEARWRQIDIYLRQARDDFSWRTGQDGSPEKPKDIFAKQNDTLNIIGGFCEYMRARTHEDIMGGDPIFAIVPQGDSDKDVAAIMQKHASWRIDRSNLKRAIADAITAGYEAGEGVMKISFAQETDYHESLVRVAHTSAGEIILTGQGEPIYEDDAIQESQDENGEIIYTLQKSPETILPPDFVFDDTIIKETKPRGEPLKAHVLAHRDFLCPPNVATIEEASFIAMIVQMRLSEIKALYNPPQDIIETIGRDTTAPKSAEKMPHASMNEGSYDDPTEEKDADPIIKLAECYLITPTPQGPSRRMAVVAIDSATVLRADYLANVTPGGSLPFFVVRPFPVRTRWYGRGYYEMYAGAQDFIDRHFNYVTYRNRFHSDPMRFIKLDCLETVDTDGELVIAPGKTHFIAPNKTSKDAVDLFILPDLDNRTWELMQTQMQIVQLRSGVTTATQGGVESLPQSNTATGINAILESGNVLSKLPIREIKHTIERALQYALQVIYANLDEEEAFTYLEGEKANYLKLSPEQVAHMDFDVSLLLTRFHQREQRESAEAAIASVQQYLTIPEPEKSHVRPLFVQAISSLGFSDAEQIVRQQEQPPPPEEQPPPPL